MDGVSDICTKGGDVNFVFTGFSVNGKVWLRHLALSNVCSAVCAVFSSLEESMTLNLGALILQGTPREASGEFGSSLKLHVKRIRGFRAQMEVAGQSLAEVEAVGV